MRVNKKFFLLLLPALFAVNANGQGINDAVTTILMKVETGLQFDVVRFNAKPGQKLKIVFENTDDMDHNMVITQPGAREEVVTAALNLGEKGPAVSYIPKSPKVLWSIPVISPHQQKVLTFTAPAESGVYPYVCTYPGHGFVMYGAMYVNTTGKMPDLAKDMNIPPNRRGEAMSDGEKHDDMHAGHHMPAVPKPLHPYKPIAPYLYRVFIEGASPAAIAVSLPDNLSYCWDAGTCRLRFAWKGGFLDNSDLWKGKGDALAKVIGKIFFREANFPFSFEENEMPVTDYKGYKLIKRYPEFHYTINGMAVYEMIKPGIDKKGLVRNFRIPGAAKALWFVTDSKDGVAYKASAGQWKDGKLKLTAAQAKNFTITMTAKEGETL
jgi:plastocyanin